MNRVLDEAIESRTHSARSWLFAQPAFWVFVAVALSVLFLSLATDTFATSQNLFNVTRNFAFIAIIALGMTVVIVSGGIDLSVGSTLCLAAMVLAIVMNAGHGILIGVAAALAASLLVGAINGVLIAYIRIPPFVTTLGMLALVRSVAMVLSNNKMVYQFGPDEKLLFWLGGGSTFGIANPVIALVILGVITNVLLVYSRWGTRVFAIGSNERAARLTGIAVKPLKISIYMYSSLMAGIAGVLEAGWLGGVTTNLGQTMELNVIASTVIGGANLMGGYGTVPGAVIGAALIEIVRNSLTLLGVSTFWQGTFVGMCILIAAAFDRLRAREGTEE
jgi:ribose transport system permease protein